MQAKNTIYLKKHLFLLKFKENLFIKAFYTFTKNSPTARREVFDFASLDTLLDISH